MKNTTKNRWPDGPGSVCRAALVSAALMLSGSTLPAGANTLNLDFTYTVVQGTCQIDVSPVPVTFGDVTDLSTAIGKDWVVLNQKTVTVTLSACDGAGDASTQPAIELKGQRANDSGASNDRQNSVFTSDNKTGLGVVFANKDSQSTLSKSNLLAYDTAKGGMFIYTDVAGQKATNKAYSIRTGLSCGTAADCAANKLSVASGAATVTFSFTYR